LEFVAGGGLIGRRSFLSSGLGFAVAGALGGLSVSRAFGADPATSTLPPWMTTPGGTDSAYGGPSAHESHVLRRHDAPGGFAIWRSPIASQRGIITPSGLHFAAHHNGVPDIDPGRHRLHVHGLVKQPLSFDLERLLRYPMVSRIQFLECAGNTAPNALSPTSIDTDCTELFGEVSCSEWTGVPLRYLLNEAGLKETAKWVVVEGADGGSHCRSLPVSKLMDDAIIALYQNGERLRPSQGYPMRLFVPGWEGNVNVKWVHRLEVTDTPSHSKDESGLYTQILSDDRIQRFAFHMEVKSVITHPSGRQVLPAPRGFYEISGLAWSGRGRIEKVEVSADNGKTWAVAQLQGPILDKAFTRFSIPWQWNGTSAILMSRAADEHGHVQPTRKEWKKKYAAHSFNHYNAIQAWKVGRDGKVENTYV
jgi:sulfane dehydrogenase subunit SoxC